MMRLGCIRSIWRARVLSTWLKSCLLSSEATPSEYGRSMRIEEKMRQHIANGKISDAVRLFDGSRNGGNSWAVDGCYSQLLHMFAKHGEHEAVERLYQDMKQNVSYIGEGAKTTMIKSYCSRGKFDQAIEMLRSITNDNIVHHTRHYDYVITSLANSGLISQALQLFEEKLEKQQQSSLANKVDKLLSIDKEMIAALLNPYNVRTKENKQFFKGDFSMMSQSESSKNRLELSEDAVRTYGRMSQKVFHYLEQAGERLPVKLLPVIHSRFNHDPVYHWKWCTSSVSETGTCSCCGNQLTSGIAPSDIHELEREIIRLSSSPEQNGSEGHGKSLDKKMQKELEDLKMFVNEQGPFDVIVDGMNVGAYGTTSSFTFTADRLIETAQHFASQQKKVLLIINYKIYIRSCTKDLHTKLEEVCAVFRNRYKNDDFYLLYAAAFSGMQQVEVITNDRLRDHRLLLPSNLWWTFLRWTRLNCVSFRSNGEGKLHFFRQKFDPVVQRCGNSWHFPAKDQTWRCATRLGEKAEP